MSNHLKTCASYKIFKDTYLTKELLIKLYINEEKSAKEIGDTLNITACCVIKQLKRLNIKVRNIKESKTEKEKQKRKTTCLKKYGVEHVWLDKTIANKKKETWLQKYGVDNPRKASAIKEKIVKNQLETKYRLGLAIRPSLKTDWEIYKSNCTNAANRIYRKIKSEINVNNVERKRNKYHLDHIYSVRDGFINNIPSNLISHPSNLRMLLEHDNISKSSASCVTINKFYRKIYLYECNKHKKNN